MQSILGIDFSAQPCELCLVTADGARLNVTSRQTVDISLLRDIRTLCTTSIAALLAPVNAGTLNAPSAESEENPELAESAREAVQRLVEGIKSLKGEWSSSVVIMPPEDHLSLNLNLPFSDAKMLDQVIDLEVQDLVPFELQEFSVQHTALGHYARADHTEAVSEDAPFDIHVGLLPRTFVANILSLCKATGVEPNVLTVPSSALGSVFHLGKDYFTTNSAVIMQRGEEYAAAVYINGQVRIERTVRSSTILTAAASQSSNAENRPIFTALKLLIAAAERRYGAKVEKLYFLSAEPVDPLMQQILGRPLQMLSTRDFLSGEVDATGISALGTVFARDEDAPVPLSNFRAREFSFTPTFGEFLRALSGARRQIANLVVSILVLIAGVYLARQYSLTEARDALIAQIRTIIPEFDAGDGDIRAALIKAEAKLSDELGVLGPVAKVTPLDALLEIMRLLPTDNGITITSIRVTNKRKAQILGVAPQLAAIDALRETLAKGSKSVFDKVTATPGSPSGAKYNFTIEIDLSQ